MPSLDEMSGSLSHDGPPQMLAWSNAPPLSIDDTRRPLSGGNWAVRRAIVRARSALWRVRLDEAAEAIADLKRLLSTLPHSDQARYLCAQEILQGCIATILKVTARLGRGDSNLPPYRHLSTRETGILKMIACGMSNKRIALSLGIAPETVKTHAKSIFVKLSTRTRAHAVARAEAIGLL